MIFLFGYEKSLSCHHSDIATSLKKIIIINIIIITKTREAGIITAPNRHHDRQTLCNTPSNKRNKPTILKQMHFPTEQITKQKPAVIAFAHLNDSSERGFNGIDRSGRLPDVAETLQLSQ